MENASILQIDEKFNETDAIKSYEWNEYLPTSGSDLNLFNLLFKLKKV